MRGITSISGLKIGLGNAQAKNQILYCNLTIFNSCYILPQIKYTVEEDELDNLDVDSATKHTESTDPSPVLNDHLLVENAPSGSFTLLQEVENVLQEQEVPVRQEFYEEVPYEEDIQLHEGTVEKEEYEFEENQDNRRDLKEEVAADGEQMECAGEEVVREQEDEETKMEEYLDEEETQESEEDIEKEADRDEEMLFEDSEEDEADEELNEEQDGQEEENETKDQTCPLKDNKHEIQLDTIIKTKSLYETDQSVEGSATVSTEVVKHPEEHLAPECTEHPSFVVMTSLELSFPKKTSNRPKETEDDPEIRHDDANEQQDILEECKDESTESLKIDDDRLEEVHEEEVLSESRQSSSSESDSIKEVPLSETESEPVFSRSPSRDQASDSMTAEPPASEGETWNLPSTPLQREIWQAEEETTPENPFGVRLRKTPVLHRYASEGESPAPSTEPMETPKSSFLEQLNRKPASAKKNDQVSDGVVKPRRTSGTNCLIIINCTQ